jgi:hypothetical protein
VSWILQTIFEGDADHFIADPSQRALEEDAGDAQAFVARDLFELSHNGKAALAQFADALLDVAFMQKIPEFSRQIAQVGGLLGDGVADFGHGRGYPSGIFHVQLDRFAVMV